MKGGIAMIAVASAGPLAHKQMPTLWCIFEKRICEFAQNQQPVFECTCRRDEEMPCRTNERG